MHFGVMDEEGRVQGIEQGILCLKDETMFEWSEPRDV